MNPNKQYNSECVNSGSSRKIHVAACDNYHALELILSVDSATLKLENQKNGWNGVCINHEWNGDAIFDPVQALGRRYTHIREHIGNEWNMFLSAVFSKGVRSNVTDNIICQALKFFATQLD
jgi:hypothetical protein